MFLTWSSVWLSACLTSSIFTTPYKQSDDLDSELSNRPMTRALLRHIIRAPSWSSETININTWMTNTMMVLSEFSWITVHYQYLSGCCYRWMISCTVRYPSRFLVVLGVCTVKQRFIQKHAYMYLNPHPVSSDLKTTMRYAYQWNYFLKIFTCYEGMNCNDLCQHISWSANMKSMLVHCCSYPHGFSKMKFIFYIYI